MMVGNVATKAKTIRPMKKSESGSILAEWIIKDGLKHVSPNV